jgi:hypothetical protein
VRCVCCVVLCCVLCVVSLCLCCLFYVVLCCVVYVVLCCVVLCVRCVCADRSASISLVLLSLYDIEVRLGVCVFVCVFFLYRWSNKSIPNSNKRDEGDWKK